MKLRTAQAADAAAITEVWNEQIRDGVSTFNSIEKTQSDILSLITERGAATIVAEGPGGFMGFATFSPFRDGPGYLHCFEHTIYLPSAARGQGVGRALLAEVTRRARAAEGHVLVAAIGGENIAAVEFHKALGFTQTGHLPAVGRKFGRWMDLILMQKTL